MSKKPLTAAEMLDNLLTIAMDDLLATSDEEILREAAEEGYDVEDLKRRARERLDKAMEEVRRRAVNGSAANE